MILKINNQQLPTILRHIVTKKIQQPFLVLHGVKYKHQFVTIKINKDSRDEHQYFMFRNRFNYRSEERFIDFRKDYYEILGVNENSQLQQIKQAFYHLAKSYHPDRNKGNDTKFKEINEAYNVLSQPNLKKDYDSNRFRDYSSQGVEEDSTLNDGKAGKANLSYGAYSQLSRAQWAVYRSGYMRHNTTDYSNFERNFSQEADSQLQIKRRKQWASAFRNMTEDQVKEELQFRERIYRKYIEDVQKQKNARQAYIDSRLKQVGNKIQRFLGKKIRGLFDRLISK